MNFSFLNGVSHAPYLSAVAFAELFVSSHPDRINHKKIPVKTGTFFMAHPAGFELTTF